MADRPVAIFIVQKWFYGHARPCLTLYQNRNIIFDPQTVIVADETPRMYCHRQDSFSN